MISIFRKLAPAVSLRNSSLVLKIRCSQYSEIDVKPDLLGESIYFCSFVLSTMLNTRMIDWFYLGLFLAFFNNLWTTYPPKYCSASISLLVTDGGKNSFPKLHHYCCTRCMCQIIKKLNSFCCNVAKKLLEKLFGVIVLYTCFTQL